MAKKALILLCFVGLKFALQWFFISPEYELQRDEFLHLDQAHHLAWGYISVPPVTSWISTVIYFLGNSIFWVRFFPALFGALTIVVVLKAIETLNGNLFALILGATCMLFSVFLRLNGLYQPNSLDALCWTTCCFILLKYANTEHPKWLYYGAVCLAIGFLNKYNIVFLILGLIPALLLKMRSMFRNKHLYLSMALFLLLILPNLIWQFQNNFPVYHHMQLLAKTQLINVNRWDFLLDQIKFFIGACIVILAGLYALLFYLPFKKYTFLFWSFMFTLAIFVFFKAKNYYAIGLYPIYFAFGAVYLENILSTGWKKYLQPIAILIPILFFIPMSGVLFPNKNPQYIATHAERYKKMGMLRWEDGKDHALPQDFADMLGWKELAHKVDSIFTTLPANERTLILCDNYGQAGAINYYSGNKNIQALSFNADYINWFELNKPYINLIRVKELENKDNELQETKSYFDSGYVAGSINNGYAREFGTTIFVFKTANIDVNERIRKEIIKEKQQ